MAFLELFARGECDWPRRRGRALPRFTFRVHDLAQVQRLFAGMFVELAVRPTMDGGLAFCLDVPDRELGTWSIALHEGDRAKLARGDGECTARIIAAGSSEAIDLAPFASGLRYDFSGKEAAAFALLAQGNAKAARSALEPLATRQDACATTHHLLGRCHRALGKLEQAVTCYGEAVRASAAEGLLHPWAAGPLSDMGVAYKKLADPARAVHCFLHSLHLRPNHPEALLSFFSLIAIDDAYVLFGVARVLAIGGRDDLADEFLAGYCVSAGREPGELRRKAEKMAAKIDLGEWPFRRAGFGRLDAFERGLASKDAALAAMRAGRWGPGSASA
jgi:tetratricopeptide (TPR) repeat protein